MKQQALPWGIRALPQTTPQTARLVFGWIVASSALSQSREDYAHRPRPAHPPTPINCNATCQARIATRQEGVKGP